jgi:hypothetical protein
MQTVSDREKLKAQLVIVTGLLLVYFLFKKAVFLYSAFACGLIFIFIPIIGNFIVSFWFKLAELIGWINTKVLLSIVYFVFLMPISFLYKRFNKNLLTLKNTSNSLYKDRNHTYTAKDLENIW